MQLDLQKSCTIHLQCNPLITKYLHIKTSLFVKEGLMVKAYIFSGPEDRVIQILFHFSYKCLFT